MAIGGSESDLTRSFKNISEIGFNLNKSLLHLKLKII